MYPKCAQNDHEISMILWEKCRKKNKNAQCTASDFQMSQQEFVNVYKTECVKITTSYKNNNEGLPKRYYCIKILPERWSVRYTASGGETE